MEAFLCLGPAPHVSPDILDYLIILKMGFFLSLIWVHLEATNECPPPADGYSIFTHLQVLKGLN